MQIIYNSREDKFTTNPKSPIFTVPAAVKNKLDGLISQCTNFLL